MPDQAALQAAELDVLQPWKASNAKTVRAKFTDKGKKTWTLPLATPLDGVVTATLSLPATWPYSLSLLTTDGKTLATGLWSGARTQTLKFTVCGQRSMVIRVTRGGPAGGFSLALAKPSHGRRRATLHRERLSGRRMGQWPMVNPQRA